MTKVKILAKLYGGKWTYFPHTWQCDDGRCVWRVASCDCDYACSHPVFYYLYPANPEEPPVDITHALYECLPRLRIRPLAANSLTHGSDCCH
jgi:hypothetical protein